MKLDGKTLEKLIEKGLLTEEAVRGLIIEDKQEVSTAQISIGSAYHQFESYLKDSDMSKHTVDGYSTNSKKFLEFHFDNTFDNFKNEILPVIITENVADWFEKLASEGYEYASIRRFKHALVKFFEFLNSQLGISVPNVDTIDIPTANDEKVIDVLTKEVIYEISEYSRSLRDKCMILLTFDASLRRQELIDLKKTHIDFNKSILNIYNNGRLDRVAILSENIKELILQYIEDWEAEVWAINVKRMQTARENNTLYNELTVSEYLFQTVRSPQISYSTIHKALKDAVLDYYMNKLKKEGMHKEEEITQMANELASKVSTETLRHSKRAWLFSEGKTLEQVQAIMGDENRWVCKRYLKIAQQIYPEKF